MTSTTTSSDHAALQEAFDQAKRQLSATEARLQQSRPALKTPKSGFTRLKAELRVAERLLDRAGYELAHLERREEALESEGFTAAQLGKVRGRKQEIQQQILASEERCNRVERALDYLPIAQEPDDTDAPDPQPEIPPAEPSETQKSGQRPPPPRPPDPPDAQQREP